jgi:hypothetical protein
MIARAPRAGLIVLALVVVLFAVCLAIGQSPQDDKLGSKEVEQILTDLKVQFDKRPQADLKAPPAFDFKISNRPVALSITAGGKALTIQATFAKTPLEKINEWNLSARFSKAYMASKEGIDRTFLERSLELEGPVTTKGVERFVRSFEDEVGHFAKFVRDANGTAMVDGIRPLADEVVRELTEVELRMQAVSQKIIPDDTTVVMTFPVGDEEWKTAWKVSWDIETITNERNKTNHFFRIDKAWFKTSPRDPWLQVLGDARVSELFAAYGNGKTRFLDIRDFSFPLLKLSPRDVGIRGRVIGKDKKVGAEIRERGLLWAKNNQAVKEPRPAEADQQQQQQAKDKEKQGKTIDPNRALMKSRRGQELVLWAALHAANYYYIIQYGFQDDGTVTFRAGATGHNLPRSPDVSHMHNTCWRVNVNLGGTGKNSVYAVTHEELAQDAGKAKQHEQLLGVEGPGEWHAKEFTFLRVKPHQDRAIVAGEGEGEGGAGPKQVAQKEDGKLKDFSYDLLPLRQGSARHYGKNEEFTHHDYWVTPNVTGELFYYNLPKYINKQSPRPTVDTDVVLWYMSSVLHVPRTEDGHMDNGKVMSGAAGVALTAWSGFDLRPRNLFPTTPLYP